MVSCFCHCGDIRFLVTR
uniref:Uncharacterized protein n=1 Tax=Anguilla anguilla TaxID=7936 RepID=A0A0E9UB29_ANGAN